MDAALAMGFLLFGILFFCAIVWKIESLDEARYQRRVNDEYRHRSMQREQTRELRKQERELNQNP